MTGWSTLWLSFSPSVLYAIIMRLFHENADPNQRIVHSGGAITSRHASNSPSPNQRSRIRSLCRSLGLGLFYETWQKLFGTSEAHETRKVAIREDRLIAALAGTIHIIPASIAISIAALNSYGYYIGEELAGPQGQDDEKLAGLQLAAKLHELTIQASLAAMLLQYIRHEVALQKGLPFGALFAGHLFKDVSFLWSSEFWGTANGTFANRQDKWKLIILLVICTIIGLTAGPASATILKPRMGNWPAGGTDFWINATAAELWSTDAAAAEVPVTCSNDTSDKSCPHGDWQTLAYDYFPYWSRLEKKGYLPDTLRIPGLKSIRELYPKIRSTSQQYSQRFSAATTQYSVVADSIAETGRLWGWVVAAAWRSKGQPWRFWSHKEATFTVLAYQPIVHARCANNSLLILSSPKDEVRFYDLRDIAAFRKNGDFPLIVESHSTYANIDNTNIGPSLTWTTISQPSNKTTALAAIVVIPGEEKGTPGIFACTVDARVAPAKIQSTRNLYKIVTSHLKPSSTWMPAGTDATYGGSNTWPAISIEPQWAAYLNPKTGEGNSTVFQTLTAAAGLQDMNSLEGSTTGYLIESVLATMIVNGLARRKYKHGIIGDLKDWDFDSDLPTCDSWCREMMPLHGSMGDGGSVYTLGESPQMNATKLTMRAESTGYAYSPKGFTTVLSIAILSTYSCIVLTHWAYMIWVKESSNSWQSSSEIAALAMNSRPTEALYNTGAGVETSRIFRQRVRIVSVGEKVELSFKAQPDQESIALNGWYS
ncbi:MAG: hypothetical protein LQ343_000737 [Gyalolechia ehrenbergii]|nr:MAG: hypothetical protein LQ343_000737 [Gyalolechia ehrenbergii]